MRYLIIVGAGDIGGPLIDIATRSGAEVVVVERNPAKANYVADEYDCLILNADATIKNTLEDAGADRADAIITTTDKDATNIMVCLLAKQFDVPSIVSVVHDPEHMALYKQIDVNLMENPQQLIAEHLFRAVDLPSIVDYLRIGKEAEVFEIVVDEGAPIANRTIDEAAREGIIPSDVLIVAIEREGDDRPITPRGNVTIHPGDLLTVYSAFGAEPRLTGVFSDDDR
ncbi:potassium channel family protein [Halosolutus gelatinilyticus]|uniref:potassium channel family protein n=1 Tax=Halosolutus gelatinilyticus TaxID=2931975 RepID=UPI001FF24AEA|nr:TrkA family potassium uptake protein [Halosolutus gelatinilyticus]